jgi:DUF4097 and DUF4098 domain-containing protein YvlB
MLNTISRATLLLAGLLSTQALAWSNDMSLQETKQPTLTHSQLTTLAVQSGAGFLNIVGSNTDTVTVKAEIYQNEPHDDYCLSLDQNAQIAQLIANNCDTNSSSNYKNQTRIDLTVSVPSSFKLNIKDGSGEIDINNTADTAIRDGSGKIVVSMINGSLTIEDGSGAIDVANIKGNVNINDGSGSIGLLNSTGDVTIHDGSGNIDVEDTSGSVTITDGSGGIYVNKAESFTLLADGSGRVKVKNVENTKL